MASGPHAPEPVTPAHLCLADEGVHLRVVGRDTADGLLGDDELRLEAGEIAEVRAPLLDARRRSGPVDDRRRYRRDLEHARQLPDDVVLVNWVEAVRLVG